MADDEQETFESGGAGAALTEPIRAGEVKKGMTVMLKGKPCKVIEITTSKTGKHGHAKANITGLDIFTGKKYVDISPTSHNMTKPVVAMMKLQIIDISEDGFCSLMNDDGEVSQNIKLPDEKSPDPSLGGKIREFLDVDKDVFVTVTKAMGDEQITGYSLGAYAE